MAELQYTFKSDTLFKMLFVNDQELLKSLVSSLMSINIEDIHNFEVKNPDIPPEGIGEKFCRLDINMQVNNEQVDLEIQVVDEGDFNNRSLYYWAREFSSALKQGMYYTDLPKTVVISIVDFKMFDCDEYHSEMGIFEKTRRTQLTDKFCMHYFELPKVPEIIDKEDKLGLWLSLFNARTDEEISYINELGVEDMERAIEQYRRITVSPEYKELERLRHKARLDEASALNNARRKGVEEGIEKGMEKGIEKGMEKGILEEKINTALRMFGMGLSFNEIKDITNLPEDELKKLMDSKH